MAAAVLLVLVVVAGAQAVLPEPCQGGPASWCRDVATASRCRREQFCHDLWDSLALQDGAAAASPYRGKKCSLCTKILKWVKTTVGKDPDEAAVEAALGKVCRVLGKRLGRSCEQLVREQWEQLSEALASGTSPQQACAALGLCRA